MDTLLRKLRPIWLAPAVLMLGACAVMPAHDALQVTVAGIEPMESERMEMRLLVKLRVQNPNDAPVQYNGVALNLVVQGKTYASGVSDMAGSVPRFGESLIDVPVTISMLRVLRHVVGSFDGKPVEKINYSLEGKLSGGAFSAHRFSAAGEFNMPTSAPVPTDPGDTFY
jgi:LEA14-like dessication related protein